MRRGYSLTAVFLIFMCSVVQASSLEFDHTTILVNDLNKSAEFYSNVLRLEELETPWGANPSIRFFSMGHHQQLHIAQGETGDIRLVKSVHFAFAVTDFDGYLSFLDDSGVAYSDFEGTSNAFQTRPDGVRQIYLQDPDGYWIEINDAKH